MNMKKNSVKIPFFLPLVIFISLLSVFLLDTLLIQEVYAVEEKKSRKPRTRRSEVLGKRAFKKITIAQEFTSEKKYGESLALLKEIINGKRYKLYEKGVAQQMIGIVWYTEGDFKKAAQEFEKAINMNVLSQGVQLDLIYNMAQFNLFDDNPRGALKYLNRWFKGSPDPSSTAYALRAQIYLSLDRFNLAEKDILKAISGSENPKEIWYRVLLSIYLQQERYKESLPILELVVDKFPGKKQFWQQLSAIYFELDDEEKGFSAQQSMYAQEMLQSSKELERLAQLYLYNNYPYKAARILSNGMNDGSIDKNKDNWENLARSWMHAREWKKARQPLLYAAKGSKEGKLYIQLGQAYLQDEDWKNAEKYLMKGIEKGKLEDKEANALLVLGITQAKLGKFEEAIVTFRHAGDHDHVAKDAFRWIRSLERKIAKRIKEVSNKEG